MYVYPGLNSSKVKNTAWLFRLGVILLLLVVLYSAVTIRWRGILRSLAPGVAAQHAIELCDATVAQSLSDAAESYMSSESISRGDDSQAATVEMNGLALGRIRAQIALACDRAIQNNDTLTLIVPLGLLLGDEWTSGIGPRLRIPMRVATTVQTRYESRLVDAGINTVFHQVVLLVTVQGHCFFRYQTIPFSYATEYLISETVIMGDVPDSYTSVGSQVSEQTKNDIINYKK